MIDVRVDSGRIALAGIAVGPGPGHLRGRGVGRARCSARQWQLVAFAAPLLGVLASIRWQRPPPEVHVHAEPDVLRCFEAEQVRLVVWGTAADGSTVELTVATPDGMALDVSTDDGRSAS